MLCEVITQSDKTLRSAVAMGLGFLNVHTIEHDGTTPM
jgi:hypothetical protein